MPIQLQSAQESSTAIANDPIMEPPGMDLKSMVRSESIRFFSIILGIDLKRFRQRTEKDWNNAHLQKLLANY